MSVRFGTRARVDCYKHLNLLAHAQMEELDIGSRCGGWGECGGDRIRIVSGGEHVSPLSDPEREHLTVEEIAAGYRLACQVFPQADGLEIQIEDR
jgi:ferredoxin